MEVYFNELSLENNQAVQYQDMTRLKDLYSSLINVGIRTCRISHDQYIELISRVGEMPGTKPEVKNFLYAFLRQPYEEKNIEERQDEYLAHSWIYKGTECYGLALAYIMDSMSVSICNPIWSRPIISIERDMNEVDIRNLYDSKSFMFHQHWLDGLRPVELITCSDRPEEKKIKLRDDHGKDVLKDFCDKIVYCEYVCEIVNSIPFSSNDRRFIHRIRSDGIIELVLPWTDKGYGVAVKTTGRTKRETEKIAYILKERYDSV